MPYFDPSIDRRIEQSANWVGTFDFISVSYFRLPLSPSPPAVPFASACATFSLIIVSDEVMKVMPA